MRQRIGLALIILLALAGSGASSPVSSIAGIGGQREEPAAQIIARERAAFDAWQRKDKAFYADYWADDFTEFLPSSPYLTTDPKTNLLPRFEKLAERWRITEYQMHEPRVQLYGDVAVLTYTESVDGRYEGQPVSYTGKVTMVYVKQGGVWRGAHYHESANPAPR